jgi:predicted transglutaminase-like cysteine proteinase
MNKLIAIFLLLGLGSAHADPITDKWAVVKTAIVAERVNCQAAACDKFREIVAVGQNQTGLARIGFINRAVNMAVRYTHEDIDAWSSPIETLTKGTGDCEDYAILKYAALSAAGVPDSDMQIQVTETHAFLLVRFEGQWKILDNKNHMMIDFFVDKRNPVLYSFNIK